MQHLSIRYAERPTKAGIDMSVASVGGNRNYALTESIIGLFKTEFVEHLGPWNTVDPVE